MGNIDRLEFNKESIINNAIQKGLNENEIRKILNLLEFDFRNNPTGPIMFQNKLPLSNGHYCFVNGQSLSDVESILKNYQKENR